MLPTAIQTNQTVGISNDAASRIRTVFRSDARGFDYPIYDGASDVDAESLIDFLRSQDSTIDYSIGEPEPDINWVAKELVGDSRVHRARYNFTYFRDQRWVWDVAEIREPNSSYTLNHPNLMHVDIRSATAASQNAG